MGFTPTADAVGDLHISPCSPLFCMSLMSSYKHSVSPRPGAFLLAHMQGRLGVQDTVTL